MKNLFILFLVSSFYSVLLAVDYEDFDKRNSGKTGYVRADGRAFEWVSTGGNTGYHREIIFEKKKEEVKKKQEEKSALELATKIAELKKEIEELTSPKILEYKTGIMHATRTMKVKQLEELEAEQKRLNNTGSSSK